MSIEEDGRLQFRGQRGFDHFPSVPVGVMKKEGLAVSAFPPPPFLILRVDKIEGRQTATKILTVKLSEDLYGKFIETVTEKGGCWRSRRNKETFTEALESAVIAALMLFLQNLDGEAGLPEFRDYMLEKYPELDEDLIIMIEDLIRRQKQIAPMLKSRTIK